ncbi:hypothetical protein ACJX0J_025615, partial [Zea mays]
DLTNFTICEEILGAYTKTEDEDVDLAFGSQGKRRKLLKAYSNHAKMIKFSEEENKKILKLEDEKKDNQMKILRFLCFKGTLYFVVVVAVATEIELFRNDQQHQIMNSRP